MTQFAARQPHRARRRLSDYTHRRPGIWQAVDAVRAEQGHTRARWPAWCYLPWGPGSRVAGDAMVRSGQITRVMSTAEITPRVLAETGTLCTLAAWRMTQGVYRYDPTLYAALIATPIDGDLPVDVLRRIPEWCVYIETPEMTAPIVSGGTARVHGVYAWLDYEAQGDQTILQLGLDTDDARLPIANLPLVGTLAESIEAVEKQWLDNAETLDGVATPTKGYAAAARRYLPPLVSLVLYLCSEAPDLGGRTPERPRATRTRDGWRLFPADGIRVWSVGERIGAALRSATERHSAEDASGTHASPRPHVRRAHWHSFWRGPREPKPGERRELVAKWLPPLPINVSDVAELPTTIRPVQGDQ